MICARNEEKVIGNLLDSIAGQDYPKDKLHVFVIADNCTDETAAIARAKGATVYERHDLSKARKGYALEFGFKRIKEDYGIENFEGYLFFDADNSTSSWATATRKTSTRIAFPPRTAYTFTEVRSRITAQDSTCIPLRISQARGIS